jgi:hypothetical protein
MRINEKIGGVQNAGGARRRTLPSHARSALSAAKSSLTQSLFLDNDSLDQNTWYSFSNVARVEIILGMHRHGFH